MFLIHHGFSASSNPSPPVKQKVSRVIFTLYYTNFITIKTNKNEGLLSALFCREKQLSSKVIIHVMGNTTSIHKVGFLTPK